MNKIALLLIYYPTLATTATPLGKVILPPIEKKPSMVRAKASAWSMIAPLGEVASQSETRASPVRSRPQPTHPVNASPSRSSFHRAKLTKDLTPSIAVHSRSSTEDTGRADTPRSSSASISRFALGVKGL